MSGRYQVGARQQKQLVRDHVSKGRKAALPSRLRPDDDERVKSYNSNW